MTVDVVIPVLGESVSEATIAKLLKKVGDTVKVDETICELETEKVSMEMPSPVSGTIMSIEVSEGDDVEVGALVCTVAEGASGDSSASKEEKPAEAKEEKPAETKEEKPAEAKEEEKPAETKEEEKPAEDSTSKASPAVAPSAVIESENKGVDLASVKPTGGLGNITKEDVQNAQPAKSPDSSENKSDQAVKPKMPKSEKEEASLPERPVDNRGEEKVPMSKLRKVISKRLKESQNTAALLTTFNEVDMTHLMELRKKYKETFEKKHGTRLGFMGLFVKAAVQALQELPAVNAEIYGNDIIYKNYKDIGIAVGSPQGLVVPILRNAEEMSVMDIEKGITDFGRRAKEGKLSISEMTGGTFTITNGGVFGSMLSTPIINPPQSAILGLHKIEKRPVVVDDEIVIRQMMYMALTYDHRIIDGREAVTFLVRIKELIEDPERLLLEI
ncbi:MAG: 2-oxoglutarate dehydrogenase complex dihydrolipoyllysine-residue succinyltransferase [Alphaproteobacteria bacterium]